MHVWFSKGECYWIFIANFSQHPRFVNEREWTKKGMKKIRNYFKSTLTFKYCRNNRYITHIYPAHLSQNWMCKCAKLKYFVWVCANGCFKTFCCLRIAWVELREYGNLCKCEFVWVCHEMSLASISLVLFLFS
jgi:hypothetical protein